MIRALILLVVISILTISCNGKKEVIEQKYANGNPKVVSIYQNDRIITQSEYYENGQLKIIGDLTENGKRKGKWQYWYNDGTIWSECEYTDGKQNGLNTVYFPNGQKRFEGRFKMGKRIGEWKFWDENGDVKLVKKYNAE